MYNSDTVRGRQVQLSCKCSLWEVQAFSWLHSFFIYCHPLINMQDLPEGQEPPVTELPSLVEHFSLSPTQDREVQRIRDELRDCALYSGVRVICHGFYEWKPVGPHLTSSGYKIISDSSLRHGTLTTSVVLSSHLDSRRFFTTIAQSIAYPKPPTAAESSDSPPYVIAVFVSGVIVDYTSAHTLSTLHGPVNIVGDIIQPFLSRSAPHLQHIPKLFFITAQGDPDAPPPHFPDDSDGNYCAAYHMTQRPRYMRKWTEYISDNLFFLGMTVQEVIENSKSHLEKGRECLHYFTCLQNKSLVLK